jgi:2-hydroxychromene-2-carboxylate isomerase
VKALDFWFDPLSPFAYLAFERLPQVLQGCSYAVNYRPVLFAAMLQAHGQKGPAEIEPKRAWTYRHVNWLAHEAGLVLHTPARHPFNPLALLRLALACGAQGCCNRRVAEAVLAHVWRGQGADALEPVRLAALTEALAPSRDPQSDAVKAELRANGDEALRLGLFGVPSLVLDGRVFWGLDSLPMVRAALLGDPWFDGPTWEREGAPREGVIRPPAR